VKGKETVVVLFPFVFYCVNFLALDKFLDNVAAEVGVAADTFVLGGW
jgi:hypothetical protein